MTKALYRQLLKFLRCSYNLIILWILASLAACSSLPEIFPSGVHQSNIGPTENIATAPLLTPTGTKEVKFASFSTPLLATVLYTKTPQPGYQTSPTLATITPSLSNASDLFFLAEDSLMRWDHVTNYMVPLAENVISFSTSFDGHRVVLLRSTGVAANGIALFNLDLLDLHTKQVSTLLKGITRLDNILISPNARWIAFLQGETLPTLYSISINEPEQRKQLGVCHKTDYSSCKMVSWSPESNSLLWEDKLGIWVSNLDGSKPILVSTPIIEVTDPKGQKSRISVTFQGLHWSPKGRYVLSQIKTDADVCWFAVLDTRQERWIEVPGTFQMSTPSSASASWMKDGKLLVVNIVNQPKSPNALIDLWQVVPTRNELLVLEKEIQLSNLRFPALSQSVLSEIKYTASWSEQIRDQVICFGITSTGSSQELYLYWVIIEQEVSFFANQVEMQASEVLWSPDGTGALLVEGSSKVVFIPLEGSQPLQLANLVGKQARDFIWAPPEPRF
jgi:hypothetical protein